MVLGFRGIADDVLAKGDSESNQDRAVLSLLVTTWHSNLKFNLDEIHFKIRECIS